MIKPVKRNKRLKWIDSHYANFYKQAVAWHNIQIAQILAVGIAQQTQIIVSTCSIGKMVAVVLNALNAVNAVKKIPKVKGRVTK